MNRLSQATSPYLLQHAGNPVDWYPWGPEALDRARSLDRPILVSIGYAACHWCHVMERESFEDDETARAMNERFVNIKVDREERPDLDGIYMSAVQAMTGQGGWPMTVFCTPDGKPFWAGTYFPPEPGHGMPSFRQVLDAIHEAWTGKRDEIASQSDEITAHLARASRVPAGDLRLSDGLLTGAARAIVDHHDPEWGGFGGAPKFPQPMTLEFLLRMHARVPGALDAATRTLDAMARGGIFDQIGGGFHRYSTDRIWLVPHFEKMLYDNGQLLRTYTRAWQLTGSPLYRDTVLATAEYLLREMQQPGGGFSSSQDADTEGVEGRFYVWPYEELIALAGDDMPLAVAAFGVAGSGNWEGTNVLWRPQTDQEVATTSSATVEEARAAVARMSATLFEARRRRVPPAVDDKVLASWNGMAIAGLAEAGRVFERPDLIEAASRAAAFVLEAMRLDGRLQRAWRDGRISGPAYLDDHANMIDACLTLFETTVEQRWWSEAMTLTGEVERLFADPDGGFFDTGVDAEQTILRPRDILDNATPSGNAVASDALLRIAALTGDERYRTLAMGFLDEVAELVARAPLGFGAALSAADRALSPSVEIAIIGAPDEAASRALVAASLEPFLPNRVVAAGKPGATEPALLAGRHEVDGAPAAYVCRNFACRAPVTSVDALRSALRDAGSLGEQLVKS